MDLDLDYRQARACDFAGIQEIFKYYICNTPIVQAHDVSGLLQKIEQNLSFPADEDDDDTPAFPTYLPVPVIVARKILDHDNSGKKSQVVGYTFLGPGRGYSNTRDLATMELFLFVHPEYVGRGIGGSLLSMLLMLVKSEKGVGSFEWVAAGGNEYAHYVRHHVRARRIVAAVSVDPEGVDGGEWLPRWLETKGFLELKRSKKAGYMFGRWIDTSFLQLNAIPDVKRDIDDESTDMSDSKDYNDNKCSFSNYYEYDAEEEEEDYNDDDE